MDKIKTTQKKLHFVELRAAGGSYRSIAEALNISKDTAMVWNRELADEVKRLQDERIAEILETYKMDKEARIRRLGETIKKMDTAIAKIDYSQIDSAKLLQLRLTYMDALKAEAGDNEPTTDDMTRAEVDELTAKVKDGTATVKEAERAAKAAARFAESDKTMSEARSDSIIAMF